MSLSDFFVVIWRVFAWKCHINGQTLNLFNPTIVGEKHTFYRQLFDNSRPFEWSLKFLDTLEMSPETLTFWLTLESFVDTLECCQTLWNVSLILFRVSGCCEKFTYHNKRCGKFLDNSRHSGNFLEAL